MCVRDKDRMVCALGIRIGWCVCVCVFWLGLEIGCAHFRFDKCLCICVYVCMCVCVYVCTCPSVSG